MLWFQQRDADEDTELFIDIDDLGYPVVPTFVYRMSFLTGLNLLVRHLCSAADMNLVFEKSMKPLVRFFTDKNGTPSFV